MIYLQFEKAKMACMAADGAEARYFAWENQLQVAYRDVAMATGQEQEKKTALANRYQMAADYAKKEAHSLRRVAAKACDKAALAQWGVRVGKEYMFYPQEGIPFKMTVEVLKTCLTDYGVMLAWGHRGEEAYFLALGKEVFESIEAVDTKVTSIEAIRKSRELSKPRAVF